MEDGKRHGEELISDVLRMQWEYYAEGGKHVIFSTEEHPLLLRVRKRDLLHQPQSPIRRQRDDTELFCFNFLAPYVVLPTVMLLPPSLAVQLRENALGCGRIPAHRQKDWTTCSSTFRPAEGVQGQLMNDFRIPRKSPPTAKCSSLSACVEIKPKAGYCAFSPLVDPTRRIKYEASRYQLLQLLREPVEKRSMYDPLDLFSQERTKIKLSIQKLMQVPHNNFKAWQGRTRASPDSLYLGTIKVPLDEILAAILTDETCLGKILTVQKLDVLDGDGAILVYERLLALCNNEHTSAISAIDAPWTIATMRGGPILPNSLMSCPVESYRLLELVQLIEEFSESRNGSKPGLDTQTMDEARAKAVALVKELNKNECIFLLQNWLLSLCFCDVSLFIAIWLPSGPTNDSLSSHQTHPGQASCRILKRQQSDSPGKLSLVTSPGCATMAIEYSVNVVDFDQKPAVKLRDRLAKEIIFNQFK